MAEELIALASQFSQRMGGGVPVAVCAEPMGPGEEGFSGAKLLRLRCTYADGGEATCIAKHTTWQERAVMQTFTGQGRGFTPAAWDTQETSREDAWLLLEDVSPSQPLPTDTLAWKAQVAQALAALHGDNLSRPGSPALLPPAQEGHWQRVTTALSLDHLQRQCQQDGAFSRRYGGLLPQLYKRGERFVREMLALSQEEATLTVTHGDLQTICGDHVRRFRDRPMVIDWGFTQRAPFYIDLVDFFTRQESLLYWEALRRQGSALSQASFLERWQAASVYPGFIYLYPALMQYLRGDDSRLEKLINLLLAG